MLMYVLLGLAALVLVGVLFWAAGRHDRSDETERFNRARELTSSWSSEAGGAPLPARKSRRTLRLGRRSGSTAI